MKYRICDSIGKTAKGKDYTNRARANTQCNKLNAEHGSYRYSVKFVYPIAEALAALIQNIDAGSEFNEAATRIANGCLVDRAELVAAYNEQYIPYEKGE